MTDVKKDLQAAAKAKPRVRLLRGDQVKLEATRWVWPGFLPLSMLSILGGPAGTGKTTIALAIAAVVTLGGKLPDGSLCRCPGDVLIWSGEDAAPVLAARLTAAGADMARVYFIEAVTVSDEDTAFDPSKDMPLLEEKAVSMPDIRLLVIDSIVSAVGGNTNNNGETRRGLESLVRFAQRYECAVLGITHFTKGTSGREPTERITGSLAFGALARLVLVVVKGRATEGDEPRRLFLRAKSNVGPDDGGFYYNLVRKDLGGDIEGQHVEWGESIEGGARELLTEAEGDGVDHDPSLTDEAVEHMRAILSAGELEGRQVNRLMRAERPFSDKVIRSAREKLGVVTRRAGQGKEATSYWRLPHMPAATTRAHSSPTKLLGTSRHECPPKGTSADAEIGDAVVLEIDDERG
jgi:hypothetical protein